MLKSVVDHGNGVSTVVALQDGDLITGTVQDCTPILEHAKALHNSGYTGSNDFKYAANYPFVVVEAYCNVNGITLEEWAKNREHKKRLLNDPTFNDFRIWKGRV